MGSADPIHVLSGSDADARLHTPMTHRNGRWRFSPDIQDSWQSLQGVIDFVGDYGGNRTHPSPWRAIAGPGGWNMPNVLIIGNFALSRTQAETQMALWSIMVRGGDIDDSSTSFCVY